MCGSCSTNSGGKMRPGRRTSQVRWLNCLQSHPQEKLHTISPSTLCATDQDVTQQPTARETPELVATACMRLARCRSREKASAASPPIFQYLLTKPTPARTENTSSALNAHSDSLFLSLFSRGSPLVQRAPCCRPCCGRNDECRCGTHAQRRDHTQCRSVGRHAAVLVRLKKGGRERFLDEAAAGMWCY